MRTTRQLSITLPNDMADVVKTKVKTGEYASESNELRARFLARGRRAPCRTVPLHRGGGRGCRRPGVV